MVSRHGDPAGGTSFCSPIAIGVVLCAREELHVHACEAGSAGYDGDLCICTAPELYGACYYCSCEFGVDVPNEVCAGVLGSGVD